MPVCGVIRQLLRGLAMRSRVLPYLGLVLFLTASICVGAPSGGQALLVPNRYTVVQFAFDVLRLRPVRLIAYEPDPLSAEPAIHLWDPAAGDWLPITSDEFKTGSAFAELPSSLIAAGRDVDLPPVLASAPEWANKFKRVDSLAPAMLANELDKEVAFRPSEWRWLAARYGFKLSETNSAKRRYGKYGPPTRSWERFLWWRSPRSADTLPEEPVLEAPEQVTPATPFEVPDAGLEVRDIEFSSPAIPSAMPEEGVSYFPEKGVPSFPEVMDAGAGPVTAPEAGVVDSAEPFPGDK